ncbi:MAG: L,D-transpeptidase/peptidoglycan binding protein [Lachnospiraceae bacterium]|nr:L,D-transpeptidase/peptidoglycan binding protein [Lachnospiraceae bacterium]
MDKSVLSKGVELEGSIKVDDKNEKITSRKRKRKIWRWIIPITFLMCIGLLIYFLPMMYWKDHFYVNTFVNGTDYSNWELQEGVSYYKTNAMQYQLDVIDRFGEVAGTILPQDIAASVSIENELSGIMNNQSTLSWPLYFQQPRFYEFSMDLDFDQNAVREAVRNWDICLTENMDMPQDAYIGEYSMELGYYPLIPETKGSALDVEKVEEVLIHALQLREKTVYLDEEQCYLTAAITQDNEILQQKLEILNRWVSTKISYDWNGNEVTVDGGQVSLWIIENQGRPDLDEEAIRTFVKEQASQYDTYGKKRTFTTITGLELSLPSGAYGWRTDIDGETAALLESIKNGEQQTREPLYTNKGAAKGRDDIGDSYVEINLTKQHLYLFVNGEILLESDFVSGDMTNGSATPAGVFGLTYKTTNAVLRGETYETPVQYWMPFNGNVGMHDATWRSSFGQDIYLYDGSHGCVNLPLLVAKELYSYLSTGFPIICYYE